MLTTYACKLYTNICNCETILYSYTTTQTWRVISAFMYIKDITPAPMQHLVQLLLYHGKQIILSRKAILKTKTDNKNTMQ